MKEYGYAKKNKLKSKKSIDLLFSKGKWRSLDSMRVIFVQNNDALPIEKSEIGVSVSKRYFKRAVDRNRVKRLLRECYRLQKPLFHEAFGAQVYAMIFWVSKEMPKGYNEVLPLFEALCKAKKNALVK